MSTPDIILHGTELSGHTHRVELLLRMLGLPYRYVAVSAAVRSTPEFHQLNPLRQIPVLQDGDLTLADSNAILVYLAKRYAPGSRWLPEEPLAAAQVQRWLSIAAGLLRFMNDHLKTRHFLAAEHVTIADLACYSYVAHAPEGGVPLGDYASVLDWLRRVEALPHFKPIPPPPIPAA
jgi:glutathione S-transferase